MTYVVRLTREAVEDLQRLEAFPLDVALKHGDRELPDRALLAVRGEFRILEANPFTCRIAFDDRLERELVIPFGDLAPVFQDTGYSQCSVCSI
ncbi:type II toxin-antitoxin system RelE/ParE family toxin [Variovorax sp. W2I14]|uniref:type II toxin-antitoxin system RelE/ParE family toxin n=1 Tax=Variovorax sp. W2I14 TaxID=3042290 RepID=UPI003D24150D